ncbi:hypothetical protein NLJ89_g3042 [Agrocybe chaxingu]|uniref:Xylanolytic transcriptional activator regulatory domain-containing protein n=1 Tax=Agrocybe chaxingu TaxID=84603 RepID=A0A9W8K6B6_9AGAR|nr:hypothetical protein NLJ89_g3042 [Agrocybe chaxingu]
MVKAADYTQPEPVPSGKRRKAEDDMNGMVSKKQRTRCDRQVPCSHCIARKVPELCKAYTPGKADQDLNARLSRLEHIIEMALPQFCTPGSTAGTPAPYSSEHISTTRHRTPSNGDDDTRSQTEEQDPSGGDFPEWKVSARFLTFDRRITECWSQLGAAVRTAQALGLHRDGLAMGMPAGTVEYRRRIWSYLYHADRSYALVLGRPNSIQDDYTSTKSPSNIDGEPRGSQSVEPLPLSRPTPMTFVILRHQLAEIIGRMVHHFQQVREKSHYSEVLALDDELIKFINNLPIHYSLQPDTSLDHTSTYVPVHRFLLITEILFVRISLHRPYMLRRLNSERYARSRNACFESAIKDFEVRQAFRETMSQEVRDSLGNAYREFQTAMISGIYFVLEPNGPHADAMHAILDGFMKDHEGMREMDETTRRELKTIEFLKSKASQVDALGLPPRRFSRLHDQSLSRQEQQAQLLLSMQQATSPSSTKSYTPLSSAAGKDTASPQSPLQRSLVQSPTLQRLQQSTQPDNIHSPTTSGSPHADDESPAQSLLDTWCNTVSNAPIDMSTGGMPWGGSVGTELSGWAGITYTVTNPDPRLLSTLDGSDYGYWEALVNQIHRGP